jgi:predicted dehydrogenase/threonine dehydrogenase-like Zn-dependent dehydrogenase
VFRKARTEGVRSTARSVQARLDDEMPLGYSAAGTVIEVGQAVAGVRVGDRVATGGAGHSEIQAVAGLLTCRVPDSVSDDEAAFATVGSIALHGLRLAEIGPGSRVVVIGLGLVGQLTCRLAQAFGCEVAGVDLNPWAVDLAAKSSADLALVESGADTTEAVRAWSKGAGADAVIVAAASRSSDPIRRAPSLARDKATLVVVGDVGLELDRREFYEKELSLRVARSYGPGRYELAYEEWGVDYPPGQVRWTEGRNQEAFIGLLGRGRLSVADLITHRFAFDDALDAYQMLESDTPSLGIELVYPGAPVDRSTTIRLVAHPGTGRGIGLIGAGAFARGVLVPALRSCGLERMVAVSSATGLGARRLAERAGFEEVAPGGQAVIDNPEVAVVVVATPHDSHAAFVAAALRAGKDVLCEKPLALSLSELDDVEDAWRTSGRRLAVDFNRRFSPAVVEARQILDATASPVVITYRVNAGPLSASHWYSDRRQGGRLLGEVCHFVDTCAALANSTPVEMSAFAGGVGDAQSGIDVALSIRFDNGSLATVTYSSAGHPSTPKEWVEIAGGGHTLVIDDFRSLRCDGRGVWSGRQDKGHDALVASFARSLDADVAPTTTQTALAVTRATLAALASILTGRPCDVADLAE